MKRVFAAWLTVVLLLVCAAAVAEPTVKNELTAAPVFWLAAPALADAQELTLAFDPEPTRLRVNLFAGSEALAASAERTEAGIRIKLLRPLRAEEELTFYADGTDSNGLPFFHQLAWQVSLEGELDLQVQALRALFVRCGMPESGTKYRVPKVLDHLGVLRTLLLFAPVLEMNPADGSVSIHPLQNPDQWSASMYRGERFTGDCVLRQDAAGKIRFPSDLLAEADSLELDLLSSPGRFGIVLMKYYYDASRLTLTGCSASCSEPADRCKLNAHALLENSETRYQIMFKSPTLPEVSASYTQNGLLDYLYYVCRTSIKNDPSIMKGMELVP